MAHPFKAISSFNGIWPIFKTSNSSNTPGGVEASEGLWPFFSSNEEDTTPIVQATHWSQPSAEDAEYLTAPGVYHTAGTIIAIVRPSAIGSTRGGIMDLRGTGAVWLGFVPGSPDTLRLSVNIGGTTRQPEITYTPGDAALYSGTAIGVWGTWASSTQPRVGIGRTDGGLVATTTANGALTSAACTMSVGNVAGVDSSFGGEYEVAYFNRVLSDVEINAIIDALTIFGHAPGDAYAYPVPATGISSLTFLTTPASEVVDLGTNAATWSISNTDGTSPISMVS